MGGSVLPLRPERVEGSGKAVALERVMAGLRTDLVTLTAPPTPALNLPADQVVPTVPALAEVLAGHGLPGLRRGASYSVTGSVTLTLTLLAGASEAGLWCGMVGMPAVGLEAAAERGIALDRLALVPDPGPAWPEVVGTLVEALDVIAVCPPAAGQDTVVRRLAARIRKRGAILVVVEPPAWWPGCELRFTVTGSEWHGLGAGFGRLRARQVTVSTAGRGRAARPRLTKLWLPDPDGDVRLAEQAEPGFATSRVG